MPIFSLNTTSVSQLEHFLLLDFDSLLILAPKKACLVSWLPNMADSGSSVKCCIAADFISSLVAVAEMILDSNSKQKSTVDSSVSHNPDTYIGIDNY